MTNKSHTLQAELRAMLRGYASRSYAHELASGVKTPGFKLAAKLESELGIPARFWTECPQTRSLPANIAQKKRARPQKVKDMVKGRCAR